MNMQFSQCSEDPSLCSIWCHLGCLKGWPWSHLKAPPPHVWGDPGRWLDLLWGSCPGPFYVHGLPVWPGLCHFVTA